MSHTLLSIVKFAVAVTLAYLLLAGRPPRGVSGLLATGAVILLVVAVDRWNDRRVGRLKPD